MQAKKQPFRHRAGPVARSRGGRHALEALNPGGRAPARAAEGHHSGGGVATGPGFPIVGIGASAGGLEAFRQLLGALPTDAGMAYVLVQHLDPRHESILADLLSHATPMPVSEVKGGVRVEPNRVYVIPPSQDIVLAPGMLNLVPRSQTGGSHMPIDSFLQTLATVQGRQSIGVILSGMASDGTRGLKAIKAEGGIAFVQDPLSAQHEGMPRSAIAAGDVDFVLPPEGIARELARLGRHPYVATAEPRATSAAAAATLAGDKDGFGRTLRLLRRATGADFSAYKEQTLKRRIARRMAVKRFETLDDYARHLEGDPTETQALYQDCLISVTSFFRDPGAFQALSEQVLPLLLKERPSDAVMRVWVPGCATGEEVYSIAIRLLEHAGGHLGNPSFQIFATDLSERALKKARAGAYPENIAQEVSSERLRRFFGKADGHYQISKTIREMCVFARHDLTTDPPFSKMDLISCRNLLIYLEPRFQDRVLSTFHYALNPSGFLMLGSAEGVGISSTLFSPVDEKHRIYSRKATAAPAHVQLSATAAADKAPREVAPHTPLTTVAADVPKEADRMLLARYGPPGVVVDAALNILEFRGDTDPFLQHGQGQASLNLIHMVRRWLLLDLRQAIQEAGKKDAPSRKEGLQIRYRGRLRKLSLEVIPLKGRAAAARCLLVLFETDRVSTRAKTRAPQRPPPTANARDRESARLRQKLAENAQYLHTVVREHEAALEELQSANEEALSGNEELQSLNEELQTAQEELQSANEELVTLNQELQDRNLQLGQSNDDLLNLLSSVNIPIVMVGKDLRLRRFTTAAEKLFSLMPTDTGRPLGDVRTRLKAPELEREIREVIDNLRRSEREVQDQQGHVYVMQIWPYLTRENKIDGAVVVLMDVDALKRSAEEVQHALDRANAIVATVREPLLILDRELRIEKANRAFYQRFEVRPEETEGRLIWEVGGGQWDRPDVRTSLQEVAARQSSFEDLDVEQEFPGIGRRTIALNARPLYQGESVRILLAMEDRTDAKLAEHGREALLVLEHAARKKAEAADHLKDEFVATVSHELRGPLCTIAGWVEILCGAPGKLDDLSRARALEAITRGVNTQERLISDLLDHSSVVTGKFQLSRRPIDLVTIAEAAIESVRSAAEAKDIGLELLGDREASVVLGDPDRMQQVFWNLFFNAIKFTPNGGRVRIWIGRVGTRVQVTVSDTGQGIRADFLPHVFERFRQQEGSPVHRQPGLGLGLTLVRELVELHGGTVGAESMGEGQGATFTILLPVPALLLRSSEEARSAITDGPPVPAKFTTIPDGTLLGLSVLVVDDEADVREAFATVLTGYGARVRAAASVSEAMMALQEAIPDVLVSDLGMPEEDGYELIRRIRMLPAERGAGLPALAVSGYASPGDRRKAISHGFRMHLAKPVALTELVTEVARAGGRMPAN
jgi:two-component system, chemotaxis family, CheB/CheR fusion protein